MIRMIILLLILAACTSCTNFAMLMSGAGIAISQNAYAKIYSGVDFLTIIKTEKDIKTHLFESVQYDDK